MLCVMLLHHMPWEYDRFAERLPSLEAMRAAWAMTETQGLSWRTATPQTHRLSEPLLELLDGMLQVRAGGEWGRAAAGVCDSVLLECWFVYVHPGEAAQQWRLSRQRGLRAASVNGLEAGFAECGGSGLPGVCRCAYTSCHLCTHGQ
jgi:hypothetical protein